MIKINKRKTTKVEEEVAGEFTTYSPSSGAEIKTLDPTYSSVKPERPPSLPSHSVLILGHSYVRDLRRSFSLVSESSHFDFSFLLQQFIYFHAKPGSTFEQWNKHNWLPSGKSCLTRDPHAIIIILGGNDFKPSQFAKEGNPISPVLSAVQLFFTNLRKLYPNSKIIFAKVEQRFYSNTNKHFDSPSVELHTRYSKYLNLYIYRHKFCNTFVHTNDRKFGIGQEQFFGKDGVHLNKTGLERYWFMINSSLKVSLL